MQVSSLHQRSDSAFAYYFCGSHVHSAAGLPQPEQTLSLIGLPHFLHGEHPQL